MKSFFTLGLFLMLNALGAQSIALAQANMHQKIKECDIQANKSQSANAARFRKECLFEERKAQQSSLENPHQRMLRCKSEAEHQRILNHRAFMKQCLSNYQK